jgi:hypothetical protein
VVGRNYAMQTFEVDHFKPRQLSICLWLSRFIHADFRTAGFSIDCKLGFLSQEILTTR